MRILKLLTLMSLAACSSGPSKSEALQVFAAATSTMASAQSRALADAQDPNAITAPVEYLLDFSGPCTLGGSLGVTGSYDTSGTGDRSAFDMTMSFDSCAEVQGAIDGRMRWTSVAEGLVFHATITGDLDFESQDLAASCDFDLGMEVTEQSVSYSGHVCGYDMKADLGLQD